MSDALTGRRVDVGGYRLYLQESGEGSPSVVLEAGAGGFSLMWGLVQPEIARYTCVVAYDRAGYARSDQAAPSAPRHAQQVAHELNLLLENAQLPSPFVLVGHAFGGFIVRIFAHMFPEKTAGLVLIDSDHEDEWTPRFPDEFRQSMQMAARSLQSYELGIYLGLPQALARLNLLQKNALQKLPPSDQRYFNTIGFQRRTLRAASQELAALEESAQLIRQNQLGKAGILGQKPLVVIRHGLPSPLPPGLSPQIASQVEELASQAQADLAHLSPLGQLWIAEKSSHDVMLDQPELVIEAVRQVVAAVRSQ